MELSIEIILLLFAVSAIAGWIDIIAGGGGLITMPVLLSLGLPPATALATNKMQSAGGILLASSYFVKKGIVKLKDIWLPIVMAFIGSVIGGWLILQMDAAVLRMVLPFLLIAIALYFFFAPNIGKLDRSQRINISSFAIIAAFPLGFYDGFFGPGTGTFVSLAFISLLGFNLSKATAHAKILNCTSVLAALLYFIVFGEIAWSVGLVMLSGQMLGAYAGARTVISNGQTIIRPVVVLVCMAMAIKLIFDSIMNV